MKDSFSNALAFVSVVCCFGMVGMLFFVKIPPENKQLVETIVPVIITGGAIGIWNFFFSSSKSSADKNTTIQKLVDQMPPQPTPTTAQQPIP